MGRLPTLVIAWLASVLFGTCPVVLAADVIRLSPTTCVRATGGPEAARYTFSATAGQGVLQLRNGDATGSRRVTAATVVLNGNEVVGAGAFKQEIGSVELTVPLAARNTLVVHVEGAPDAQLTVTVTQQVEMPKAYTYAPCAVDHATAPARAALSDVRPSGINGRGDIVGSAGFEVMGSVRRRGFTRTVAAGGPRLVDPTEGRISGAENYATGINDAGEVVGYYTAGDGREHGYAWDGAAYVSLDVPGAVATFPAAINNRGEIVGHYRTEANCSKGFIKDASSYTTIDVISDSVPHETTIRGLNNAGQAVGVVTMSKGANGSVNLAFLTGGGVFSLFKVPFTGSSETMAYGINDSGAIVGTYRSGAATRGFLRAPSGAFMELDVPGADSTFATGINKDGTIVGYYWNGGLHCFTASPVW